MNVEILQSFPPPLQDAVWSPCAQICYLDAQSNKLFPPSVPLSHPYTLKAPAHVKYSLVWQKPEAVVLNT